jgi:hypothetical protein
MKSNIRITGDWQQGMNAIKVNLAMISFEEDGSQIMYCPALDLSGYGKNEKDAFKSFSECLTEYFNYTLNKGTLSKDLERMGWSVKKNNHKKMKPPTMQQLLESNDNFRRVFNNFPFRKFDQPVSIPAA